MRLRAFVLTLTFSLQLGCGPVTTTGADAGGEQELDGGLAVDAGTTTGGQDAGGVEDAGRVDAGADAGSVDGGWRSALYPADWRPDRAPDDAGRFLHDFSYAGYRRGEVSIPDAGGTVFAVTADTSGQADSTLAFQLALDSAADAGGGVVHVPPGLYRIDGQLVVRTSGVELRGEGSAQSRLFFTKSAGMSDGEHLSFRGNTAFGEELPLVQDGHSRAVDLLVADAGTVTAGDLIAVGFVITDAFIAEHGMTGTWVSFNGQWKPFFRREVTAVDRTQAPHRITVDVPLRYAAKVRDLASIRVEPGRLREVGVRGIGVSNAVTWSQAWATNRAHAIGMRNVTDGYLVDVATFPSPIATGPNNSTSGQWHLQSSGVYLLDASRVTIKDSRFGKAQNRGVNGNGYLVELSKTSDSLVTDTEAVDGRHNFIQNWDFGTTGNVFLRCKSARGKNVTTPFGINSPIEFPAMSEFHHSLAMANLIDSSTLDDGWKAINRGSESSGAGISSTEAVFWNARGAGSISSQQFGHGYVIGTEGVSVDVSAPGGSAPADWLEGQGKGLSLAPTSLYEDQRTRRLTP